MDIWASFPGLLFMVCENTQTEIERPVNKAIATQFVSFPDPLYGPVLTSSPAPPTPSGFILQPNGIGRLSQYHFVLTESTISGPWHSFWSQAFSQFFSMAVR